MATVLSKRDVICQEALKLTAYALPDSSRTLRVERVTTRRTRRTDNLLARAHARLIV